MQNRMVATEGKSNLLKESVKRNYSHKIEASFLSPRENSNWKRTKA